MYAKLRIELDSSQISYQQSSNLQGVLMEQIDTDYAQELHQYSLNPYSQYVVKEKDKTVWYICTVNEEAYENIILPLEELKQITIRSRVMIQDSYDLHSMTGIVILLRYVIRGTFFVEGCGAVLYAVRFIPQYGLLQFCTPTAFKRDGKYVNYPDLRLVYGSLMRKYSAASEELNMYDEETLEELVRNSEIIRYRLQTMPFPLEKVQINGFVGNVCIKIKGTETMANYIRLLCRFGEYSGVGIKTSMGMGAMQLHRREKHG